MLCIDIASMLNCSEENLQETRNNENDGIEKKIQNSSNSLETIDKSLEKMNNKESLTNEKENIVNEQNTLLEKLGASSKEKITGSLIVHYFYSAKRPLTFVIATFLLAQVLASNDFLFP